MIFSCKNKSKAVLELRFIHSYVPTFWSICVMGKTVCLFAVQSRTVWLISAWSKVNHYWNLIMQHPIYTLWCNRDQRRSNKFRYYFYAVPISHFVDELLPKQIYHNGRITFIQFELHTIWHNFCEDKSKHPPWRQMILNNGVQWITGVDSLTWIH